MRRLLVALVAMSAMGVAAPGVGAADPPQVDGAVQVTAAAPTASRAAR